MNRRSRGFSLIELTLVAGIIMLISAMAIPQIQKVQTRYKLDTSGHAVAGLLQQARLQAVRSNQPAYAQFDTSNASANLVYVNGDKSAYVAGAAGVPVATTNGGVTIQATIPSGLVDQLSAYLQGTNTGVIVETPGTPIGFSPRGVPCVGAAGNPAVCVQQDPNNSSQIVTFLWMMTTGQQNEWEAVTVTAGGKIKTWQLAKGVTSCGYSKCWQ